MTFGQLLDLYFTARNNVGQWSKDDDPLRRELFYSVLQIIRDAIQWETQRVSLMNHAQLLAAVDSYCEAFSQGVDR